MQRTGEGRNADRVRKFLMCIHLIGNNKGENVPYDTVIGTCLMRLCRKVQCKGEDPLAVCALEGFRVKSLAPVTPKALGPSGQYCSLQPKQ